MAQTKTRKRKSTRKTVPTKHWTCANCSARNPGQQPYCDNCTLVKPDLVACDRALAEAFTPTLAIKAEWSQLAEQGATDEQLLTTVCTAKSYHQKQNGLSYASTDAFTVFWDPSDVEHCDRGVWLLEDGEEVPFGGIPSRDPDLPREELAAAVRDLFHIKPLEGTSAPDKNPPSGTGGQGDGGIGGEVPIGFIFVPQGANPRTEFDKQKHAELVQSIKELGLLQPLVVRQNHSDARGGQVYELLAGERRLRAAKAAKLKTVPIVVRNVDDKTAAMIRLEENLKREDLNPIDKARALQALLDDHGFSHQELADKYELSKAVVGNAVRLLKLPEPWQQRVISQEITQTQGRELATYADVPAVLKELETWLKDRRRYSQLPVDADDWKRGLMNAIRESSRPLKGQFRRETSGARFADWVDVALTKKEKEREDLDVREVPTWQGKEKRAFNVQLFDELQAAGEERRAQRRQSPASGGSKPNGKPAMSAEEKRRRTQQKNQAWQKKLETWYLAWLQQQILDEIDEHRDIDSDPDLFAKIMVYFSVAGQTGKRTEELVAMVKGLGGKGRRSGSYSIDVWGTLSTLPDPQNIWGVFDDLCRQWLRHDFTKYDSDLQPAAIRGLAVDLGISLETHWQLTADFLVLHTKDQLAGLAKEWKISCPDSKRSEVIAHIIEYRDNGKTFPVPKELAKIAKGK